MIRSLAISKTGLDALQTRMDVTANNLANVGTNGFKRSQAVFEDMLYQTISQPGAASSQQNTLPAGLQVGTGVRAVATVKNFSQGNPSPSGNPFDIAINGNGFFQVQLPDGTTGYTRDGVFHKDENGNLVTSHGFPVQPAITLPGDATSVTVAADGTVSVVRPGQTQPQNAGTIQLVTFMNPAGLQSMGQNTYVETAASGTPNAGAPGTNGRGLLQQGYTEGSNVNVVEELVSMIQTQRAYEINSKAIQTSDQMLQKLSQL